MGRQYSAYIKGTNYNSGSWFTSCANFTGRAASDGTGARSTVTAGTGYQFIFCNPGAAYPYAIGYGGTVRCWVQASVFPNAHEALYYAAEEGVDVAVPESKRGTGKFDVLIKANDLTVYTIRITKNPKNFAPEYQTALTDDIIRTAKDIYVKCWTANNIKVGEDAEKWKERKRLQEEAARDCNNLLALMQIAKTLFHLETRRVKHWGKKTIEVRNRIRDWKDGDSRRYNKLLK